MKFEGDIKVILEGDEIDIAISIDSNPVGSLQRWLMGNMSYVVGSYLNR